jgi:hypothetical protein
MSGAWVWLDLFVGSHDSLTRTNDENRYSSVARDELCQINQRGIFAVARIWRVGIRGRRGIAARGQGVKPSSCDFCPRHALYEVCARLRKKRRFDLKRSEPSKPLSAVSLAEALIASDGAVLARGDGREARRGGRDNRPNAIINLEPDDE